METLPPELRHIIYQYAPCYVHDAPLNHASMVCLAFVDGPEYAIQCKLHPELADVCRCVDNPNLSNEAVAEACIRIDPEHFICCENPYTTEYYLQHQELIDHRLFCWNTDDRAVQYIIDHNWCDEPFFSENENQIAVDYLLNHQEFIHWPSFSRNRNITAVTYLINHPDKMMPEFALNENMITIEYIYKHFYELNREIQERFCRNGNAFRYLIKLDVPSEAFIDSIAWVEDDAIVDYILYRPWLIDKCKRSFAENIHPRAYQYRKEHGLDSHYTFHIAPDPEW